MLLNLHKRGWTEGLKLKDFNDQQEGNEKAIEVSDTEFAQNYGQLAETLLANA